MTSPNSTKNSSKPEKTTRISSRLPCRIHRHNSTDRDLARRVKRVIPTVARGLVAVVEDRTRHMDPPAAAAAAGGPDPQRYYTPGPGQAPGKSVFFPPHALSAYPPFLPSPLLLLHSVSLLISLPINIIPHKRPRIDGMNGNH